MQRKIVLWGTGFIAKKLFNQISDAAECHDDYIVYFCDNDDKKQGTFFHGIEVISPHEVQVLKDYDILVIANSFSEQVIRQIELENICPENKVYTAERYTFELYSKVQYYKRYGKKSCNSDIQNKIDKLVVYTAITGNYDDLKNPAYTDPNIKYICFTDNSKLKSEIWDVRYLKQESDKVRQARKVKICPWEYMDCEGINIWVDGKFLIKDDLRKYCALYSRNSAILCFPHFCRNNICDETAVLALAKESLKKDVIKQTGMYLAEGFSDDWGLFETGCIMRDFESDEIKNIMKSWWHEIENCSVRDQLSLPYVCWKYDYKPDISDLYIEKNLWLDVNKHNE